MNLIKFIYLFGVSRFNGSALNYHHLHNISFQFGRVISHVFSAKTAHLYMRESNWIRSEAIRSNAVKQSNKVMPKSDGNFLMFCKLKENNKLKMQNDRFSLSPVIIIDHFNCIIVQQNRNQCWIFSLQPTNLPSTNGLSSPIKSNKSFCLRFFGVSLIKYQKIDEFATNYYLFIGEIVA